MTIATSDLTGLNELAGSRRDGYTSEDVQSTSGRISEALGYDWVVVWDYYDYCGTGGSSEEFLRAEYGVFYAQPAFLAELLFEGVEATQETVDEQLAALMPLAADDSRAWIALDEANYALRVTTGDGRYL